MSSATGRTMRKTDDGYAARHPDARYSFGIQSNLNSSPPIPETPMTPHTLHLRTSTRRRPPLMSWIERIVDRWEARRIERKLGYNLPPTESFARLYNPDAPRGSRKSRRARHHLGA